MHLKFYKKNHFLATLLSLCCVILFVIQTQQSFAKATLYDGRDGLNSKDINAITKDNRGLIWIGTANGLQIFDGYTFSKFEGPLANMAVTNLKYNPFKKEMLVGTTRGLFSINLITLTTHKINYRNETNNPISLSRVSNIYIHSENKSVYFSINHGIVLKVDNETTSSIVCRLDTTSNISHIEPYDKDHIIINNSALYLINLKTGKSELIKSLQHYGPIYAIYKSADTFLFSDFNSRIFFADKCKNTIVDSACRLATAKLPFRPVKSVLKSNLLYSLCDNYNFVIYDITTGRTNSISKKYPEIFEGKVFVSLYIDENNIIWIGTNKGLIKVEERVISFSKALYNLPQRVSTRKLIEDENGDIFACSYSGLWHLSKETQQWTLFGLNNPETAAPQLHLYNSFVLPLSILPTPNGEDFYIGFDSDRLLRFNKQLKLYEDLNIQFKNPHEKLNNLSDMLFDKNGILWMAGYNGLATYDPTTNIAELHRNGPFSIGNIRVRILHLAKTGNLIYLGTVNGFFVFDIEKGLVKKFSTASTPALTNNDILYVGTDKKNNIWLGTNGGGINIISADLKDIRYIRKQDGLSNEIVYSMLPENDNVQWIATFNGLDRYQIDKNSFTNFFEEDGISSNEFNQNSFLKTKDGQFYFGSINGLTTFYPQQFEEPAPFRIFFAGISKWDNKEQSIHLNLKNLESGSTIEKGPSDQLIELHFGCSDYSDPQRNSYSYRIKEISNNWISLDDRHSLNIGGLPYGQFTLEVKAINTRGASSANTLLYYLKITQPFYKTWWFFGLILAFIALIFYVAYLIKYQSFKNILHLRMKIASNLHDEVGSLLTRITMFSDNLRYSKNNEEQRNIKLEKIAILSRNAVASMSDVLWAIDSRNDFAGNLLDRMREQAEEMLFPLGIDVNFVLSVADLKKHIGSDTRGEIYLIFKEAINNIVKHSNATEVEIVYKLTDKNFLLKISNNGMIASVSEISTGQGLNNMKMRAQKIGAQVTFEKKGDIFSVALKN
jgi:ligand-binding sensor domain-containing protein/two-component sensor histidine kinase